MKKVLVVDDDADILEVVKLMLSRSGFDVHTHSSGYKVTEVVEKYDPDIILLDINLPGKQGTDICKELKAISPRPPILLFSAHAKREVATLCEADGFVQKPFDMTNLIDTIKLHTN